MGRPRRQELLRSNAQFPSGPVAPRMNRGPVKLRPGDLPALAEGTGLRGTTGQRVPAPLVRVV